MPDISFTCKASAILAAIDGAIVTPTALTAQAGSISACARITIPHPSTVPGAPLRALLQTRGESRVSRVGFALDSFEGESTSFIAPMGALAMLRTIAPEATVTISYASEGHMLTMRAPGGLSFETATYRPELVPAADADYALACQADARMFPTAVLLAALQGTRGFLPAKDSGAAAHFETARLFDATDPATAKGNGHLFSSDGSRAFDFHAPTLEGKSLVIHTDHVPSLCKFLAQTEAKEVAIREGQNMIFACDESMDRVLGWTKTVKTHTRYAAMVPGRAKHKFRIATAEILNAIDAGAIALSRRRAGEYLRARYTHADGMIRLSCPGFDSLPTVASAYPDTPNPQEDYEFTTSPTSMRSLFETHGNEVTLLVALIAPSPTAPRGYAMLQTLDCFEVEKTPCTATRFAATVI